MKTVIIRDSAENEIGAIRYDEEILCYAELVDVSREIRLEWLNSSKDIDLFTYLITKLCDKYEGISGEEYIDCFYIDED